jgi:hypothetical protein
MSVRLLLICLAVIFGLAACVPMQQQPVAVESPAPTPAALAALNQVQSAYRDGAYDDVLRLVAGSVELAAAPAPLRVEAYKLQAFSYCVRNYPELCKDAFLRILRIDPSFSLAPSEAGHPQWGPVFRKAQQAVGR